MPAACTLYPQLRAPADKALRPARQARALKALTPPPPPLLPQELRAALLTDDQPLPGCGSTWRAQLELCISGKGSYGLLAAAWEEMRGTVRGWLEGRAKPAALSAAGRSPSQQQLSEGSGDGGGGGNGAAQQQPPIVSYFSSISAAWSDGFDSGVASPDDVSGEATDLDEDFDP